MAERRPDRSPSPEDAGSPAETPAQAPSAERIDPLSVAASGLVDVSDLPADRPRLRGRLGRRREPEREPVEAPRRPGEQTEPLDPLAVLARALDAEDQPGAPSPAASDQPAETSPRHRQRSEAPAVPSAEETSTAAADVDLPAALVELAAAADDAVPLEPRRRGTFRRRHATGGVGDAAEHGDEALFEVPVTPDDTTELTRTTVEPSDPGESVTQDDVRPEPAATEGAEPRGASDDEQAGGTTGWQPLHEPEPYVEPAAPRAAASDAVTEEQPVAGLSAEPEPAGVAATTTRVAEASDDVTEEWSDDDLQATEWAAQWSSDSSTPSTPSTPSDEPASAGTEQDPALTEEQSVSREQPEANEAPSAADGDSSDGAAGGAVSDTVGDAGDKESAEPRRRGFLSRRRGAKPEPSAEQAAAAEEPSVPSEPTRVSVEPASVEPASAEPASVGSDITTPLGLLSGYTSAAGGAGEPVTTSAAEPAAVPAGSDDHDPEHELWDEPDTDEDTPAARSHEGRRSRRKGAPRRRVADPVAAAADGTPAGDSESADEGAPAEQATEPATETSDYPWTAADLAGQGWTREDLIGAGWNEEQLLAVGWSAEFEASLHAEAPAADETATETYAAEVEEQAPPAGADDPVQEVLSAEDPTAATDDADRATPGETETDQALAETTDDPVEELVSTTEPATAADEPDTAVPAETEADQALAETTEDPAEELVSTTEPATAADEPDTAVPAETVADQALAETTDDPVEELVSTTEPATVAATEPAGEAEHVAPLDDAPAEETLEAEPVDAAELVVEEATVAADEHASAARPMTSPAAPQPTGDFDLFFDDDFDIEPESFDIEAPLAERSNPGTPAPVASAPVSPVRDVPAPAPEPVAVAPVAEPLADDAEPQSDPEPESEPEAEAEPEPGAEPESEAEPGAAAESEPEDTEPQDAEPADSAEPTPARDVAAEATDVEVAAQPAPEPDVMAAESSGVEESTESPAESAADSAVDSAAEDASASDRSAVDESPQNEDSDGSEDDEDDEDEGDTGWSGPDDGPDGPDPDEPDDASPVAEATQDASGEQPADEPEPMTYAWALAELTADDTRALAGPPTAEDASSAPVEEDQPGTEQDAEEQPTAAHDPAPPAPPPGPAAPESAVADEELPATSWSPTWEPTGPSAAAEWPSTASPASTASATATSPATSTAASTGEPTATEPPSAEPPGPDLPTPEPPAARPLAEVPARVADEAAETSAVELADVPAATDGTIPSADATAAAAEKLGVTLEGDQVPAFVEYRPSEARRYVLGTLFVVASVLAVLAIFYAVQQGSTSATITAAAVTVLAGAFWWGLLSWAPTIVSISRGILEVAQGPNGERFDLRDPATAVDVGDNPRSRSWTTTLTRPNGTKVVIKAGQVRPQQFSAIVRHYRELGETTA